MRYCSEQLFRSQFEFLKRQFLQDGGLPFTNILSRETFEEAFDTIEFAWNERIYPPLVTLWVFLGQVLSADRSCRNAVGSWSSCDCTGRRKKPSAVSGLRQRFDE